MWEALSQLPFVRHRKEALPFVYGGKANDGAQYIRYLKIDDGQPDMVGSTDCVPSCVWLSKKLDALQEQIDELRKGLG